MIEKLNNKLLKNTLIIILMLIVIGVASLFISQKSNAAGTSSMIYKFGLLLKDRSLLEYYRESDYEDLGSNEQDGVDLMEEIFDLLKSGELKISRSRFAALLRLDDIEDDEDLTLDELNFFDFIEELVEYLCNESWDLEDRMLEMSRQELINYYLEIYDAVSGGTVNITDTEPVYEDMTDEEKQEWKDFFNMTDSEKQEYLYGQGSIPNQDILDYWESYISNGGSSGGSGGSGGSRGLASWIGSSTWGMPSFGTYNPTTGLLPQQFGGTRSISIYGDLFNSYQFTQTWSVKIEKGLVLCADQVNLLRNGHMDLEAPYYVDWLNTYEVTKEKILDKSNTKYRECAYAMAPDDAEDIKITTVYIEGQNLGEIDLDGTMFHSYMSTDTDIMQFIQSSIAQSMLEIQAKLAGEEIPVDLSSDIDNAEGKYTPITVTATHGAQKTIMETSQGADNGYTASSGGTYASTSSSDVDIMASYILSAADNSYTGASSKYTEEDVQSAYWQLLEENGVADGIVRKSKWTANGGNLYRKAQQYLKFIKEVRKNDYETSIDSSKAQVIVDRANKQYIVGPFSTEYLEYEDISYIKGMYLTTDTGYTLKLNEKNADFEIILGTGATKSNGLKKIYPKSGEKFFIKFSASKTNYPTSVELSIDYEYLESSYMKYNNLTSSADIYRYYGYANYSDDYKMNEGTITARIFYTYEKTTYCSGHDGGTDENGNDITESCGGHTDVYGGNTVYSWTVWQPVIRFEYEEAAKAQPLTITIEYSEEEIRKQGYSNRNYKVAEESVKIDLTMELGGEVWEDSTGGKESLGNGSHGSEDTPMPNVIVTLYRADGQVIGTTKTDKNGKYKFTKLNAMYQYYVKFTYNGQYYEPTYYKVDGVAWSNSSKGTDYRNEREDYNEGFESIGSSPANYVSSNSKGWLSKSGDGKVYNETFTKMQLLGYTLQSDGEYKKTREAVIDDFGNLILESSSDSTTRKMIQFVIDCYMNSYTANENGTLDLYPIYDKFVIDTMQYPSSLVNKVDYLYDGQYYVNQGYSARQQSDLTLKKDVDHVTLEINGQTHTYTYDTIENAGNADDAWEISVRLSDAYYNTNYSRELYKSDYIYKASDYGNNYADYGKNKSDELEVYVTYKVMVRNQSQSIRCRVDEIVDYYDTDYEYIDSRSYVQIKTGENKGIYSTKATGTSRYENKVSATRTEIDGYDNLYIQGLDGMYLTSGQTAYVYLTFKVKKDTINGEDWVRLDEEIETATIKGVGKENIAEINGYSTLYKDGTEIPNVGDVSGKTVAGIIDRDSNPGNLNKNDVPKDGAIKYENFEDDTDKAPNLRLKLYRDDSANRVISGVVWEDDRDESIGATTTGDGIRKDSETLINGVTVQLVELMDNGTEFIWRTFENGSGTASSTSPIINAFGLVTDYQFADKHDGTYAFKSFVPGKYVVRFIYGDTEKTVLTKDASTIVNSTLGKTGLNEKSYNGNDFKSTTYQEGIEQNKKYTWREDSTWSLGQETLGNIIREILTYDTTACTQNEILTYLYDITASDKISNVSDAKDIESRRKEVIDYSDSEITNHIAEVLASFRELPTYPGGSYTKEQLQSLIDELIDRTKMKAETGVMVIEFEYDRTGTGNQTVNNNASYAIKNVDLGLEERAKSQLVIDKEVTNVKITLADGSILFDAKSATTNVLWRDHEAYDVGYKGNFLDTSKFTSIENIRNKNSSKFGLIQLSMDEELMHGSTMEITYQITVTNVGEVDYKDNRFYYTGNVSDTSKVVTTKANQVIDYIANNLQFYKANNPNWRVISQEDLLSQGLVNTDLKEQIAKYNTIIITDSLSAELVPTLYKDKIDKNAIDSVSVPLVLTQLITSENETDDLTYRNIVEVVKTSNTVGRKNEYSVVGNQDPTKEPQEMDSDRAETVRILPPFGDAGIYYIIAAVVLAAIVILVGGTIFIKKKVLKKE